VTLTNRLTLFFLSALTVVLIGFSLALFVLAQHHLQRQADERLAAALSVLKSAVEMTDEGVEWEPFDRNLAFSEPAAGESVTWLVTDPEGRVVDRAGSPAVLEFATSAASALRASQRDAARFEWNGARWLFRQLWIESPGPVVASPTQDEREHKYQGLAITVGLSLAPVQADLRALAVVLAALTAAILLLGLIGGRAVCRRALRPVTVMADAARRMNAAALDQRLPINHSGDELEDLARAFNGLLERVHDAFERQRRFTGEASHQLRTPLAAMLGQVEVALRRERPLEEYRRVLGSVQQQSERLQRIIEAMLFLARADAEAQLPQRDWLDLAQWLPQHLALWSEHPRFADISLEVQSARVRVHVVLLGELVNVLLDNAVKHSAPGTPIAIRVEESAGTAVLSVTDRGIGVNTEDLPHLFEAFFRSSSARASGVEGLGLGLSVARRIVEAFGGTIRVDSQPGSGSCFSVRLPSLQE
jgi:heavy metal sensor kinase